VQIDYLL